MSTKIAQAIVNSKIWVDSFKPNGNPDVKKIHQILSTRIFKGKPVNVYVARDPLEAQQILLSLYKEFAKKR